MQRDHVADGWSQLLGKPAGTWPGTKNARDHRVWLSEPAQGLTGSHLAGKGGSNKAGDRLRGLVAEFRCCAGGSRLAGGLSSKLSCQERTTADNFYFRATLDCYFRSTYSFPLRRIGTTGRRSCPAGRLRTWSAGIFPRRAVRDDDQAAAPPTCPAHGEIFHDANDAGQRSSASRRARVVPPMGLAGFFKLSSGTCCRRYRERTNTRRADERFGCRRLPSTVEASSE